MQYANISDVIYVRNTVDSMINRMQYLDTTLMNLQGEVRRSDPRMGHVPMCQERLERLELGLNSAWDNLVSTKAHDLQITQLQKQLDAMSQRLFKLESERSSKSHDVYDHFNDNALLDPFRIQKGGRGRIMPPPLYKMH